MSAYLNNNGNSGGAFWSPELSLEYAHGRRRGAVRPVSAPKRPARYVGPWMAVRDASRSGAEYLVFLATVMLVAMPRPAQGTLPRVARDGFKRTFDVAGAVLGLVLALPLLVFIPILIKLDSPGPVFYRQVRVGLDRRRRRRRLLTAGSETNRRSTDRRATNHSGQLFELFKFRSMVQNAERSCGPVWASKNDPRVTRLGRFLRRSRIDEIPQLFNVLVGQMSLVGPRPERPHFVNKFCHTIDQYSRRHRVKPGITGLAQIEHGYDSDEREVQRKVQYDLHYIRRWNPLLDLRILVRTVQVVFSGRGAQ